MVAIHSMHAARMCMHGTANNLLQLSTNRAIKDELEEAVFLPLRHPHL